LLKFPVGSNYCYLSIENGIEGAVSLRFVIGEEGYTGNIEVLHGVFPCLTRDAVK